MYLFAELFFAVFFGLMLFQSAKFGYDESAAVFGFLLGASLARVVLWAVDWYDERK